MSRDELNRLLKVLKENDFGVQNILLGGDRGYTDARIYSLKDQRDNGMQDEGKGSDERR